MIPEIRIRTLNSNAIKHDGDYVLYWMTAFRRLSYNFSLDRSVEYARELNKPLLILEALRCDYPWASDRLHRFVIEGMRVNAASSESLPVHYYPYIEPEHGAGSGLLEALALHASVVITDDFPCFFLPKMIKAAAKRVDARLEAIDGNGLLPMRATEKVYPTAYAFRRYLQKSLPDHLAETPEADPFVSLQLPRMKTLPTEIKEHWPCVSEEDLKNPAELLSRLPIDHSVKPSFIEGGTREANKTLERFLDLKLPRYLDERNEPEQDVPSGLSPYLHWGHISTHQIFNEQIERESWTPLSLSEETKGKREGWWGMSPAAESFLDELITWREVGFNFCALRDDYDRYESLPDWARATLETHASDPREYLYSLDEFEEAQTHDELWNAAQNQLVLEGRIHNYLRMVWGKKILEWTESPQKALEIMIHLNNKYSLDGRNPNSYSGIFWCLGRYDRAWGEREIFGKIRYMSSANTARKVKVKNYIRMYTSDHYDAPHPDPLP